MYIALLFLIGYDILQTSPGQLYLKWDLSGRDECKQFYDQIVFKVLGPRIDNDYSMEILSVPRGQEGLAVQVPKDALVTFK